MSGDNKARGNMRAANEGEREEREREAGNEGQISRAR